MWLAVIDFSLADRGLVLPVPFAQLLLILQKCLPEASESD